MNEYHRLCGVCPAAAVLAHLVGFHVTCIPEFRDCYIDGECVVIYCRCGGVLREDYAEEVEHMRSLPHLAMVHEQADDPTYVFFHYKVPSEHAQAFALAKHLAGVNRNPGKLMREAKARVRWAS